MHATPPKKILFTTDLSNNANAAWPMAAALARDNDAQVFVVYVEQPPVVATGNAVIYAVTEPSYENVQRAIHEVTEDEELNVDRHLITGDPARSIVRFAEDHDIDLIVMSTHGRTGLTRLLMGSVAEKVVRKAPCPVLTLKSGDTTAA